MSELRTVEDALHDRCTVVDYLATTIAGLRRDLVLGPLDDAPMLRALSLWQPFASLVADGLKPIETRLRRTNVRGRFVVCATKAIAPAEDYRRLLRRLDAAGIDTAPYQPNVVPTGCALGVANLIDCRPMVAEDEHAAWVSERTDDGRQRWAWVLAERPVRLRTPVRPVQGFQGWFGLAAAPFVGVAA